MSTALWLKGKLMNITEEQVFKSLADMTLLEVSPTTADMGMDSRVYRFR